MKLDIMSLERAVKHTLPRKTYVIRIKDWTVKEKKLAVPKKWKKDEPIIKEYNFDDVLYHSRPPWEGCGECNYSFGEDIAKEIIRDFRQRFRKDMDLLVHCIQGISRSPAIAISLNDLCELGFDSAELKEAYPRYNSFVYKIMLEAGRK